MFRCFLSYLCKMILLKHKKIIIHYTKIKKNIRILISIMTIKNQINENNIFSTILYGIPISYDIFLVEPALCTVCVKKNIF